MEYTTNYTKVLRQNSGLEESVCFQKVLWVTTQTLTGKMGRRGRVPFNSHPSLGRKTSLGSISVPLSGTACHALMLFPLGIQQRWYHCQCTDRTLRYRKATVNREFVQSSDANLGLLFVPS